MDVKNIFNKVKSALNDFIESQKGKTPEETAEQQQAEILAQNEQVKKSRILQELLKHYPEEMSELFWGISEKYETWGELAEDTNFGLILNKHITYSRKKSHGNPYSHLLAQAGDYWTATEIENLDNNISFDVVNLESVDSMVLIPDISTIHKLQKVENDKPALLIYYYKQKEQIIPYFHFVE